MTISRRQQLIASAGLLIAPPWHLAEAKQRIVVTGSSTLAPLVSDAAKRFEQSHPGVQIDVQTGGTSRGIKDARQGIAEIGMVSRDLKEDEKDLARFPVAYDGVTLLVHRSNPVATLTDQQVRDIFTGKFSNWKALGGNDERIVLVNKAEGRSTLEVFLAHFGLRNSDIKPNVVIGENLQGIKTVAANPSAIAYVSIGSATVSRDEGVPIKLLSLNGVNPTLSNVQTKTFPLTRTLHLITGPGTTATARQFVQYLQSGSADDLVKTHYFVPLAH